MDQPTQVETVIIPPEAWNDSVRVTFTGTGADLRHRLRAVIFARAPNQDSGRVTAPDPTTRWPLPPAQELLWRQASVPLLGFHPIQQAPNPPTLRRHRPGIMLVTFGAVLASSRPTMMMP